MLQNSKTELNSEVPQSQYPGVIDLGLEVPRGRGYKVSKGRNIKFVARNPQQYGRQSDGEGLEMKLSREATTKFSNTVQRADVIDLGLEVNLGREETKRFSNASKKKKTNANPYRLCSAYAGYRILRLSLELFIIAHSLKANHSITMAGSFFLIYSLCDVSSGSIYLWYPDIFFGSYMKSMIFVTVTVGFQVGGYLLFFSTHDAVWMALSIGMCGIGTSSWFVNYQSIIQFSCTGDDDIKKIASVRQIFEAIGFLVPSISLGIMHTIFPESADIFSTTAYVLGVFAFLFYAVSFYDVINLAARSASLSNSKAGICESMKLLWESSTPLYFSLNSILLALSNILGGTLAVMTTEYFGLEEDSLWVGAIGIPIGGMLSAAKALLLKRPVDDLLRFYSSSFWLVLTNILLFAFAGAALDFFENNSSSAYATMFFFGTTAGYFFCEMWAVVFACWLKELGEFSPSEVSRANSIHNIGVQVVLAVAFQLQTLSLDTIETAKIGILSKAFSMAAALYGTLIFLVLICIYLYGSRPDLINMSRFHWPKALPLNKFTVKFVSYVTKTTVDTMLFAAFSNFRTNSLIDALSDDALTDGGALSSPPCTLNYSNFVQFLNDFDERNICGKSGDAFYINSSVNVNSVIFSNSEALATRMDMIENATSSIFMLTWSLDGDSSIDLINEVIRKHRELGVDVKVMVDGVNFYYRCLLFNTTEGVDNRLMAIKMLIEEGIEVRFIVEDVGDANYRCGSHSKILLVDDKYMVAGGRNMEDSYLTDEGMFLDTDLVLEGNFTHSTKRMLDKLWENGTDVLDILEDISHLDKIYSEMDALSASIIAFPLSKSIIEAKKAPLDRFTFNSIVSNATQSIGTNASLICLHHITGGTDGIDIIYSSILKLIESATTEITLVYGYFQLFSHMEKAISEAIERGVRVKLFTNSSQTGDIFFLNPIFTEAQRRLFEMGAEVHVLNEKENVMEDEQSYRCVHHKFMIVDNRTVIVGSWNCMGVSVFYDSEFAMILFEDEENSNGLCQPFKSQIRFFSENGTFRKLEDAPAIVTHNPFVTLFMSRQGLKMTKRGY